MMQRSLSLDIDTTYYKIEDCTRLADGGFQLVVREHHGGTEWSSALQKEANRVNSDLPGPNFLRSTP